MRYTFTNKKVKIGDTCVAYCLKEHIKSLKIESYFTVHYNFLSTINKVGIKVVWVSDTRIKGYLVKKDYIKKKVVPYKKDGKLLYITLNTGNNICIMKHDVNQ